LLVTNTFIPLSLKTDGDMPKDLRRYKVNQYIDNNRTDVIKQVPDRKVMKKEARVIMSINSNQRNMTTESDLDDPTEYLNYVASANYNQFIELYNLAKNLNRAVQTYADYVKQNGAPNITVQINPMVRNIVSSLLYVPRDMLMRSFPTTVTDINSNLIDLLNDVAVNVNGRSDYESMTNVLNAFVMSGTSFNPSNFWRPFYFTGYTNSAINAPIRQIVYKEQLPNHYTVTLPRIVNHVKSLRLISTEIPNTVNNITERNNIITIQLQYTAQNLNDVPLWNDVPLDPNTSLFNFILVTLDIGLYTLESLIQHMKAKINAVCVECTMKKYGDLFDITFDASTGVINIICRRKEVRFHMKFYSELSGLVSIVNPGNPNDTLGKSQGVITEYGRDLWYLLGFPWPYEIGSDGANKYTQLLTNQVPFGLHSVFTSTHVNNDIFDRQKSSIEISMNEIYTSQLVTGKYTAVNTYKPYRYPDISVKYIYLVLRGYKSINHINQYNNVISFKDNDIFAKVLLTAHPGEVCYNTYIDNPLIFLNVQDKIESLEVSWVDEQGSLVDFNKVDHSFTLEMIHYVTQVDTNGYHTSLGEIDDKSYPDWLNSSK